MIPDEHCREKAKNLDETRAKTREEDKITSTDDPGKDISAETSHVVDNRLYRKECRHSDHGGAQEHKDHHAHSRGELDRGR